MKSFKSNVESLLTNIKTNWQCFWKYYQVKSIIFSMFTLMWDICEKYVFSSFLYNWEHIVKVLFLCKYIHIFLNTSFYVLSEQINDLLTKRHEKICVSLYLIFFVVVFSGHILNHSIIVQRIYCNEMFCKALFLIRFILKNCA